MNNAFVNLLVRWFVLALGVMLSTKIVPGISYDTGTTLAVVVLLLSFFNAVLKPLLLLFTLPAFRKKRVEVMAEDGQTG